MPGGPGFQPQGCVFFLGFPWRLSGPTFRFNPPPSQMLGSLFFPSSLEISPRTHHLVPEGSLMAVPSPFRSHDLPRCRFLCLELSSFMSSPGPLIIALQILAKKSSPQGSLPGPCRTPPAPITPFSSAPFIDVWPSLTCPSICK